MQWSHSCVSSSVSYYLRIVQCKYPKKRPEMRLTCSGVTAVFQVPYLTIYVLYADGKRW